MIPLLIIMAWEFSLPSLVYENSPFHQLHPANFPTLSLVEAG